MLQQYRHAYLFKESENDLSNVMKANGNCMRQIKWCVSVDVYTSLNISSIDVRACVSVCNVCKM